ncbi:MAG: LacI family DNA-binding transcriptional regulator, partial [Planctomycetota bacterium]
LGSDSVPVTLRDIARTCGVDVSTVSRALRDDARVRPATRIRIQEEAVRLGYRPNIAARNLVTGRTNTLCMLASGVIAFQDPRFTQAASERCHELDFDLLLNLHHNQRAAMERAYRRLRQFTVDGVLVLPCWTPGEVDLARGLVEGGFPLICVDRPLPDLPVRCITSDNDAAITDLLQACAASGATHLATAFRDGDEVVRGRQRMADGERRRLGLATWDGQSSLPPDACPALLANQQPDVLRWLDGHPAAADVLNLVACFDDWEGPIAPARCVLVCRQDYAAVGRRAAEELIALVRRERTNAAEVIRIPYARIDTLPA